MNKYLSFKVVALVTALCGILGSAVEIQGKSFFVLVMAVYLAFWVGAVWMYFLCGHEAKERFGNSLDLVDENGKLNPLIKIGAFYKILATINWCSSGERLHLLQGRSGDEDGKIFCVLTKHDLVLPQNFRVIKRVEDRGHPRPITSFVFE